MIRYVLGFAFSQDLQRVVLIQKNKPPFQHGKFNGIGGKCELEENPDVAMMREFQEETGVRVGRWNQFVIMEGKDWECWCFFSILTPEQLDAVKTVESEFVVKPLVSELPTNCMRNIHWLVPMALNWDAECQRVLYGEVRWRNYK